MKFRFHVFLIQALPAWSRLLSGKHTKYTPLSCNEDIATAVCNVPLSALVGTNTMAEIAIPCGKCVTVDYSSSETVSFPGGLHIVGKLHFPPSASVTIETPHVIVQGVLKMEKPALGNTVKLLLSGTDDVSLYPYDACCAEVAMTPIFGVSCDKSCGCHLHHPH
mmetsp:Transcript_3229/g.7175  ORF Transcript_3229/g.7175 Transcript_3229/m.7175 type:complete len:164 (-) Transcript_3229:12-503(-)